MATLSLSPVSFDEELLRSTLAQGGACAGSFEHLLAIAGRVSLAAKQYLPVDPEQDRMVFILKGAAKLEVQVKPCACSCSGSQRKDGAHGQVLSFHFPGDFVPVLRRPDAQAHLAALTPLECLIFPTHALLNIAAGDSAMLRIVLARAFQAVDAGRSGMIRLASASASERLEEFLRAMAVKITGWSKGPCEFSLPMSRREIADHLGLTIETVSRQFAALRDAGVIETEGRSLVRLLGT
ncbi:Crp/Fnr family transcriptional regulator [Erythrobacter sp. EC-HK427]|uniref:Crp/Fnr family transcriptional regulator n=1 Tax=Erythrobacter sp. EC-HK427 TaxID=2038396 RepID=UPI001252B6A9|nr:Crp/Fnr family transcriptional regulator [Erythrobacter sp. EC-HK427]VVT20919.1 conserved hypothetical protein [Erythrobacter sp. EC-HK427]